MKSLIHISVCEIKFHVKTKIKYLKVQSLIHCSGVCKTYIAFQYKLIVNNHIQILTVKQENFRTAKV